MGGTDSNTQQREEGAAENSSERMKKNAQNNWAKRIASPIQIEQPSTCARDRCLPPALAVLAKYKAEPKQQKRKAHMKTLEESEKEKSCRRHPRCTDWLWKKKGRSCGSRGDRKRKAPFGRRMCSLSKSALHWNTLHKKAVSVSKTCINIKRQQRPRQRNRAAPCSMISQKKLIWGKGGAA